MATWTSFLQNLGYLALLFFVVPIQYNGKLEEEKLFDQYIKDFNKTYDNQTEYERKFAAFKNSLETIEKLNAAAPNGSAKYGLTKFSDMLPEEFSNSVLLSNLNDKILNRRLTSSCKSHNTRDKRAVTNLPNKVDWRNKKIIGPVHNQGNCGACWAISAIETIESLYAIKSGKFEDLSVQQMIDCAGNSNNGCNGGDICLLLDWLQTNRIKVQKETDYPTTLKTQQCTINPLNDGLILNGYECTNFINNEEMLRSYLASTGPVTVTVNAHTWQNYVGGVIQFHCISDIDNLNHAVQIVGYDLTADNPYYIIRNSWGADYGDNGYLYIAIDKNVCGLAFEVISNVTFL